MKTRKILVVEKESIDGAYMRNLLERIGWSVDWVQDGALLLSRLENGDYEAVLLSSSFLDDQDLELTRRLRNIGHDAGHDVAVIGVASNSLSAERQRFERAGIDQCLTKPVYQRSLSELLG